MRNSLRFAPVVFLVLLSCATVKRRYAPVGSSALAAETEHVTVSYVPGVTAGVVLELRNKTDKPITIVWDESSFVDGAGETGKITRTGASILAPAASMTDTIVPEHVVEGRCD